MRTHEDVAAAAAAHSELGHQYNDALAEGLIERISSEIDKQVDVRLAQRGIQPSRAAWANVAMGLGSVGLGIGATAVTLHSLSSTGTAPKATVNLGPFHASGHVNHHLDQHRPGGPCRADLGCHWGRQHRLRPPSSKSSLGHQGPDSLMLVISKPEW